MRNTKHEYEQAAQAFSINETTPWQKAILAPIVLPMSIFWGIMDFIFQTLPDTLLKIDRSEEAATKELDLWYANYNQRIEAEQVRRKAEIKAALWPEHYTNQ